MKSDQKIYKDIQGIISSKKYDDSLKFIEVNKHKLSELDYWFLLSVNLRYLKKYKEAIKTFKNFSVDNDPANNCLDVAIITDSKLRSKKTKKKLLHIAGRVLTKKKIIQCQHTL